MSKLFRQLDFTGGLNTYDDKTRLQNNQLQTADNVEILRDGTIQKRKGFLRKTDFGDTYSWYNLLPAGIIIKILKYKGFWFFFYSDGRVISNYRENLIIDWIEDGLNLEDPRSNYEDGWLYEISKYIDKCGYRGCNYRYIYDNENFAGGDEYEAGYGKVVIEETDGSETRSIIPGDILWMGGFSIPQGEINGFNIYMPDGNNISFWVDTDGNTYWDKELKNVAYMKSLHQFQNINLKASVKFNNDYILSDGEKLYKLSDIKYESETNNRAFAIINDTLLILKRDTGEILNKVKFEITNERRVINFTYDKFENKIYIIQEWQHGTGTTVNLQIIDLYTLQVIENHSYNKTDTVDPRDISYVKVDKDYVWFFRMLDLADAFGHKIDRINKSTFQYEERIVDNPWNIALISSFTVDYFGDRLFVGFQENQFDTTIIGHIYSKDATGEYTTNFDGISPPAIGSILKSHQINDYFLFNNLFIYNNYLFGVYEGKISAFKKNQGSNDYTFITDYSIGNIQDIALYDKTEGDLLGQFLALICIHNNTLGYTLFSFGQEIFSNYISLFENPKGNIKISKDQIYREQKIYIDEIDRPIDFFAYSDKSIQGTSLNGIYNYKIKYRTKNGLESIESDVISEIHTNNNPVIIEDIYLPSYMDTVLIYRQKQGEQEWVFIGETTENYFIDYGNESIIEKSAGKQYKSGNYIVNYYQRLFIAGIPDKENYLFFSEVDIPEYFPVENFIIIHQCNNITGLIVFNDNLYIFSDKGIFKLSGYSMENFNLVSINEDIINVINKTVCEYQNYLIYQSNKSVYIFDGYNNIDIGQKISPDLIYSENNFALISDDKYFLFFPNNYVLVYDLKLKNWIKYNWNFNYADIVEKELLGVKNNEVYNLLTGYTDNGNNITSIIKTKRFEIGDALTRKIFERIHFIFGERNSSILVKIQIDDNTIEEYTFNIQTPDSGDKVLKKVRPVRGRGKYFEIEFTEQSNGNNFKLYGIETKYREIPAR